MADVMKIKHANIDGFAIREEMEEMRGRLHLLNHAVIGIMSSGIRPSDYTLAGVGQMLEDCEKITDRVNALAGA